MKNCITCKYWQYIKKTQEVYYKWQLNTSVMRKVGICLLDDTYTTESYICTKLNNNGRVELLNYEEIK